LVVLAANWFWWGVEASATGGMTAWGGYPADGHWYIGNDGLYAEVGEITWIWSLVHSALTIASFPLIMGLLLLLVPGSASDAARRFGWLWDAQARSDRVPGSGSVQFQDSPSIVVAGIPHASGEIMLACYPAGITISVPGLADAAIHASDATAVREVVEGPPHLVIEHTVGEIGTPLEIITPPGGALWSAVLQSLRPPG
jgi:hypothetical protein